MRCKIILYLLISLANYTLAQPLILDKINDIPIRDGRATIKTIEPLSKPDSIAVLLEISDYSIGGEHYDDISVITKNALVKVLYANLHPFSIPGIYAGKSNNELIALAANENNIYQNLILRYKSDSYELIDTAAFTYDHYPKLIQFSNEEFICFGRSNISDSILLHQLVNFTNGELALIWSNIVKDRKVSLWSGRFSNELYLHALADNYEESNNFLVYHKKYESPNIIQYNSSNKMQNEVFPATLKAFWPLALINDTTVYVACLARREVDYEFTHRNYIVFSINLNTQQLNWQYHGVENWEFDYFQPTPNGVHLYYKGRQTPRYEFINSKGELVFEDDNSELIRYCTQNDECIVYRNDTLFLKKFGEVLAFHAIENRDQYLMYTYHPDDKYHYVSLREKGSNIMSIYQLKLDTLDTGIFNSANIETFELYPNPASTTIQLQLPVFQTYHLDIINVNGQVVEQLQFTGQSSTIQPVKLTQGAYWLQAIGENEQRYVSRLVWLE